MKVLVVCIAMASIGLITRASQPPPDRKEGKPTLLVGFFGGINFSQPQSIDNFEVLNYLGTPPENTGKTYSGLFQNIGNQFGFVMFYPVKGNFHTGLLPSYASYNYTYITRQSWQDAGGNTLDAERTHEQKLRYFEIPLVLRYYMGTGKVKPYVEGILSYGFLHNALKTVTSDYLQNTGSTVIPVQNSEISADYSSSFITSKIDIGMGAGISYDFDQLILTLGASYMQNFNNITDEQHRYTNQLFSGSTYDVQDNLNLNSLKINLAIIFPISKITRKGTVECHYFKKKRK